MSSIEDIPLLKIKVGVQPDEDFIVNLSFFYAEFFVPLPLTGITFNAAIGDFATLSTASGGGITIQGSLNNQLVIQVLAAAKEEWPADGTYKFSLLATDGTYTRDILANSTLRIGVPALGSLTNLSYPGNANCLSPSQPPGAAVVAALAALPSDVLITLMQPLIASLPVAETNAAPVPTGEGYVNSDGFLVKAQ